jgi:hypothetical protein
MMSLQKLHQSILNLDVEGVCEHATPELVATPLNASKTVFPVQVALALAKTHPQKADKVLAVLVHGYGAVIRPADLRGEDPTEWAIRNGLSWLETALAFQKKQAVAGREPPEQTEADELEDPTSSSLEDSQSHPKQ